MTTTEGIDSAGTANLAFLEELFAQYQHDPESLSADWRQYFDSLVKVSNGKLANGHSAEKHRASTDDQLLKSQHNGTTANSSVGHRMGQLSMLNSEMDYLKTMR